jgi:hypothetical protein
VASATWGEADVLHRPLTIGAEEASTPIEVTLRNDGAEVSGSVQLPETLNFLKSRKGVGPFPLVYLYFVPIGESGREVRRAMVLQDATFDETQIAPGTYRILFFDHPMTELGAANSELMRKYETKGVVVELSASQKLRLASPLALVSEP